MNLSRKIHQLLIINHLIIKIISMKKILKILSLLLSIFIIFPSYAGVYDDWPDEASALLETGLLRMMLSAAALSSLWFGVA